MQTSFRDPVIEKRIFFHRALVVAAVIFILLAMLVWRLVYLQVTLHDMYSSLSENNRLQLRPIAPNRGLIYDRHGVVLAENIPSYSLTITMERVKDLDETLKFIDRLIGIDDDFDEIKKSIQARRRPFEAISVRHRLSEEAIAKIMVNRNFLPGVDIEARLIRHYPQGETFGHVLGYVGRINQKEQSELDADSEQKRRYSATQYIGKLGVEHTYESDLHGEVGYERVEMNAHGRVTRVVERQNPVHGHNIGLHLDSRLQQLALKEMQGMRGALVAIEVKTGGILAIHSNPGYDPNLFVTGISHKDYNALREDLDLPLFDRTTRGRYPPASTLKPFVGLAVLDGEFTKWDEQINDKGRFQLPNDERVYRDWKRSGHGLVNLERAIVESCDTYFYEMSVRAGIDQMSAFLGQFGFGRNMTYDLGFAQSGLLPDREWKQKARGSFWFPGDTVNFGIGQGYTLVTPLQLATATAVLANKGRWEIPRLLLSHNGKKDIVPHGEIPDIQLKDPQNWEKMNQAMHKVVTDLRGTAHRLSYRQPYAMAAKTGTAQVVSISQDGKYDSEALHERQRDHALFIAYAPVDDPKIAIATIIENGESAGRTAGPISKAIINAYLEGVTP